MHSLEEIDWFHRALNRACGYPGISLDQLGSDTGAWHQFLKVMGPLEETDEGRFDKADMIAVMTEMRRQKDQGVGWSMRPSNILRDPQKFRDLVLEERAKAKRRTRPARTMQTQRTPDADGATNREIEHDPAAESDSRPLKSVLSDFLADHAK